MVVSKKSWIQSSINKKMEFQRTYMIFSKLVNKRAWTKNHPDSTVTFSFPQNIRKTPNGYRKQGATCLRTQALHLKEDDSYERILRDTQ